MITPTLCTIRFDNEQAGMITGQTLIKLIKNENVEATQKIHYQFIKGASVFLQQ